MKTKVKHLVLVYNILTGPKPDPLKLANFHLDFEGEVAKAPVGTHKSRI